MALRAVPDPRKHLTDGVLLEASVLAHILGVRLLTLDMTVVLVPADVAVPSSMPRDPPMRPAARPSGVSAARSGATGRGLAEAVRSINEGAELLAISRRNHL